MKTVLITAYAVNPYKGSEDGTGWNIAAEIAKDFKVILITRKNNVKHVEQYLANHSEEHLQNITCYGFDLTEPIMKLKKKMGERGYVAYFYLWQYFMPRFIRKKGFEFDIAHSLNFHSDSQPNFLWKLGKPTFWGPIGHHPKMNKEFLKHYGAKYWFKDRLYACVKWMFRNLDPFFRMSVNHSTKIFVINSSIRNVIAAPKEKVVNIPAVAAPEVVENIASNKKNTFNILTVGRFHYLKGFDVAISAYASFLAPLSDLEKEHCRLIMVGKGEEKHRLINMAERLKVSQYIVWKDWVEQSEMDKYYKESDVFFFPSHEGAGMVTVEAMSYGLPIICFDNFGPGEIAASAAIRVPDHNYQLAVDQFAAELELLRSNYTLREDLGKRALERFKSSFTWESKGNEIKKHYRYAC